MDTEAPEGSRMTELGPLPIEWEAVPLGDIGTLQRGNDLPNADRRVGPYPVIGSNGVVGFHSESVARGPGVLVGRSGSVGKVAWVEHDFWPLNTALWVKDFHGNDPRFVYYLLSWLNLGKYAAGVSVPTLNRNLLHPLKVALPPLPEQHAIAHVLRTVQRAKEATEAVITATRELKKSLMRHLFSYGPVRVDEVDRVVLKETEFGSVPVDWSIIPLAKCAVIQTGTAKGRHLGAATTVMLPYLRVANVQDGFLDLTEIKYIEIREDEINRYRLVPGDVLLTEGGDFDKLGRGCLWDGEIGECVHQNHIFAVRTDQSVLRPEYLAYLTQSEYGKSYFLTVAHRTTHLACINSAKLKALPVPVASKMEQRDLVCILRSIDRKLVVEERRTASLDTLFETLLHDLMTGRLRVGADLPPEVRP